MANTTEEFDLDALIAEATAEITGDTVEVETVSGEASEASSKSGY